MKCLFSTSNLFICLLLRNDMLFRRGSATSNYRYEQPLRDKDELFWTCGGSSSRDACLQASFILWESLKTLKSICTCAHKSNLQFLPFHEYIFLTDCSKYCYTIISQACFHTSSSDLYLRIFTSASEISFRLWIKVGSSQALENLGPGKPNWDNVWCYILIFSCWMCCRASS